VVETCEEFSSGGRGLEGIHQAMVDGPDVICAFATLLDALPCKEQQGYGTGW
jgi:hypothetical protein